MSRLSRRVTAGSAGERSCLSHAREDPARDAPGLSLTGCPGQPRHRHTVQQPPHQAPGPSHARRARARACALGCARAHVASRSHVQGLLCADLSRPAPRQQVSRRAVRRLGGRELLWRSRQSRKLTRLPAPPAGARAQPRGRQRRGGLLHELRQAPTPAPSLHRLRLRGRALRRWRSRRTLLGPPAQPRGG